MRTREYENDAPINDDLVVLDLLYDDRWEWKIERRLYLPLSQRHDEGPYVRVARSEYSIWDFRVTQEVSKRLLVRGLISGKKHWGFTDDRDLGISDQGRTLMRDTFEQLGIKYDDHFIQRLRADEWIVELGKLAS